MPKRILVVDDEKNWRDNFKDIFDVWDFKVDATAGCEQAQDLLGKQKYDLALIDICLNQYDPNYVSFQKFCMFLREKCVDLPILATSGKTIDPAFMFHLRSNHGVSDFVSKNSLSLPEFKKQIEATIQRWGTISILFLASAPTDAARLRLGEEYREINDQIERSKGREKIKMEVPQLALRTRDISQALLDKQPRIVHFSGHGAADGALCFENQEGQVHCVLPAALADLFQQFAEQVNCVILNACYSKIQADAIAKTIRHVIGMKQEISDKAAIAFSIGFYQALGAGRTISDAYGLGCAQIGLEEKESNLTPVFIKDGITQ